MLEQAIVHVLNLDSHRSELPVAHYKSARVGDIIRDESLCSVL